MEKSQHESFEWTQTEDTNHLRTTGRATSDDFPVPLYSSRLRVSRLRPYKIVDGQFDRLFWSDTLRCRWFSEREVTFSKHVSPTTSCGPIPP